ncbi:hypothetical protein [Delftia sp. WSY_14]|uniref:hypothetical protein n=1 Tax=unclassified Delftia TaxID=2613839 RepID=UPI00370B4230
MEEKMHWLPTTIGMVVLVCIFGGIALGIYPGWDLLGDFLNRNVKINLDQNAPAWVQAVGSIVAIGVAFTVIQYQLNCERKRMRDTATALLNTFGGTLNSFKKKFPTDGSRSLWDIKTMRALLAAEIERSSDIPLHALSLSEQRGVFAFRLAAYQIMEGINFVEPAVEVIDGNQYIIKEAYDFFVGVIQDANTAFTNGRTLLGAQFSEPNSD